MNHIKRVFTETPFLTVASEEGGADVSVPAVASTIAGAIQEITRSFQFDGDDTPDIVTVPFGRGVLFVVYTTASRDMQPTLLTFVPDWLAEAEGAGYRLEGPGTDKGDPATFEQHWYTLTRPGWSDIECSESFRTAKAAENAMAEAYLREFQLSRPEGAQASDNDDAQLRSTDDGRTSKSGSSSATAG